MHKAHIKTDLFCNYVRYVLKALLEGLHTQIFRLAHNSPLFKEAVLLVYELMNRQK